MRWQIIGGTTGDEGKFISSWKTDNSGSSSDLQIALPLIGGKSYDMTVDWGDGTTSDITSSSDSDKTHTYAEAGTYTVKIEGTNGGIKFNDGGDKLKILEISQWGTFDISSDALFYGCSNLNITARDTPLRTTTGFDSMFRNCASLVGGVSSINTTGVQTFRHTFRDCALFNGDISTWDTSSAVSIERMFSGCTAFNKNIGAWNVSSVTSLQLTFLDCSSFNQDISGWDVSSVTRFTGAFNGCTSFNQDIGAWDVSSGTFGGNAMFFNCLSFDQDLSAWDVTNWADFSNMFSGCRLSTPNYDALLIAWAALNVQDNKSFHGGSSTYSSGAAATARQSLIDDDTWTITDGGLNEFILTFTNVSSVTLPILLDGTYDMTVDWGDASSSNIETYDSGSESAATWLAARTHTYATLGDYTITITGTISGWSFEEYTASRGDLTDISNWGPLDIDRQGAFYRCTNLDVSAVDSPSVSSTDLTFTFYDCESLTNAGGVWPVGSVTTFQQMFQGCILFNSSLDSWDVSSGVNFVNMFSGCAAFNSGVGSWDVSAAENMQGLFFNCSTFNKDISGWDVSACKNFNQMFAGAAAFNQDISGWDLSSVRSMDSMFLNAASFNQPIGSWDISNLYSLPWGASGIVLTSFLSGASSFDQNLSGLNISDATQLYSILSGCGISVGNYNLTLIGFASQNVNFNVNFGSPPATPTGAGLDAKNYLITNRSWIFS